MEAIFKPEHVGQVVSDPHYGDGLIKEYDQDMRWPVSVYFKRLDRVLYFSVNGTCESAYLPTLQFGLLDNWQRRTEPQVKDGDLVEVYNLAESQWYLGIVSTDNQDRKWATLTRSEEGLALNMKMLLSSKWRFFKP